MYSSIVLALLAGSSVAFAAPSVSVTFEGDKVVKDVDNFKITTKVSNTGDETLTLLNDPNSLLTPHWYTKTFAISSSEGASPEFKGVAVKWSPKAAHENKAYTVIAPGASVSFEHKLGGVYNFTSTGASSYEIVPTRDAYTFTHVTGAGEFVTLRADVAQGHAAQLTGKLTPTAYVGAAEKARAISKRAHKFVSCTSSEQTSLNTAGTNAQTYADNAYTYLTGISAATTRFTTWFGTYTAAHKSTVQTHYSNIRNGQLATDTFDCTCTEADTYAYVYPDTFGYIYLCGAFWSAPATGTDSKAGTLIHESSHFTTNGGTQDYVYGQTAAKSLAKSNSAEAIMNADNHEYFAENNPAQS